MMIEYQMTKRKRAQKVEKLRQFLLQHEVDRHVGSCVKHQVEARLAKKENWREEDVPDLDLLPSQLRLQLR
eukprot:14984020-Alexandrium_andersonii.AAC.1